MRWAGSFGAYASIGKTLLRTVHEELDLELAPGSFVPTMTNATMNMLAEEGMNFHSPTPAHLKRQCPDCYVKEDADG